MSGQCYNFNSVSHQVLFDWINNNASTGPNEIGMCLAAPDTSESEAVWHEFATLMATAQQRVQTALAKAGAEWTGGAADQMNAGVTPMGAWAGDAHAAGSETHGSVAEQAFSYSCAKRDMPPPAPVTSTANSDFLGIPGGVTHLMGGQTDQDMQQQKADAAKAQAVSVMNNYEASSSSATSSVGAFTAPPAISGSVGTAPASTAQVGGYSGGPGSMYSGYGSSSRGYGSYGSGGAGSGVPGAMNPGNGAFGQVPGAGGQPGDRQPPVVGPNPIPGVPAPVTPANTGPWSGGIGQSALFGGAFAGGLAGGIGSGLGRGGGSTSTNGLPGASEEEALAKNGISEPEGEGRMARGGVIGEEEGLGRNGGRGAAGANGMAGGGAGAKEEEDKEHKAAAYLEEMDDVWSSGETVAPSVIGE